MRISKFHVGEELAHARKVFTDPSSPLELKVDTLYKLVQAGLKILVDIRINTVRIMRHLRIPMFFKESQERITESPTNNPVNLENKKEGDE